MESFPLQTQMLLAIAKLQKGLVGSITDNNYFFGQFKR